MLPNRVRPVSPVRQAVLMTDPVQLPRLPRLPLRTAADLIACAEEMHSDRCSWMGREADHPCRCRAPRVIRMIEAVYGDLMLGGG